MELTHKHLQRESHRFEELQLNACDDNKLRPLQLQMETKIKLQLLLVFVFFLSPQFFLQTLF